MDIVRAISNISKIFAIVKHELDHIIAKTNIKYKQIMICWKIVEENNKHRL